MRMSVLFNCLAALALLGSLHSIPTAMAQEVAEPDATVETTPGLTDDTDVDASEVSPADEEVSSIQALFEQIRSGGKTMFFLLILSVVGLAYMLERFVHLRRGVIAPANLADEADKHWRAGQFDEAAEVAAKSKSTLGRVIQSMVEHRDASTADINTIAGDIASRDLRRHLMRAYPLAVVATLAPLLGLLGTIIGMIQAFSIVAVSGSMGDASVLADSISLALVTTGVGLGIAVPTLAAYHFFRARTNLLGIMLEEDASELATDWFVVGRKQVAAPAEPTPPAPEAQPQAKPADGKPE